MPDLDLVLLATRADAFKELRDKRLALKRELDAMYQLEKEARAELVQYLEAAKSEGITGVSGANCHVSLRPTFKPIVEDWDALYSHIQRTGEFELIQRRVGEGAVKERWDDGVVVPGVIELEGVDLSITKP